MLPVKQINNQIDNQQLEKEKDNHLLQLNDRYRIKRRLSDSTWLVDDLIDCTPCLMKDEAGFADAKVIDCLEKTRHPSIPRILMRHVLSEADLKAFHFRIDSEFSGAYVLYEFIEGVTLREWLVRHHADKQAKSVDLLLILSIMKQGAQILRFLHEQNDQVIMHLDIKPENIILADNNQIYLIDYDAAAICHADLRVKASGRLKSTPEYSAPELLKGSPGPQSDIFALSLTALQLITGAPVTACRNQPADILTHQLREKDLSVKEKLISLFENCLSENTDSRPGSAGMLIAQIDDIISETRYQQSRQMSAKPDKPGLTRVFKNKKVLFVNLAENINGRLRKEHRRHCCPDNDGTQKNIARKAVTTIWGNAEFGCELATVLCENASVLVAEADWFNPQTDQLLGLAEKKEWLSVRKEIKGMDQALSDQRQGRLTPERLKTLCQPGKNSNLKYLMPKRDLHHYEHYQPEDFCAVMELASQIFDHVIVLANTFIYDAFTCLSLMIADYILIPLAGNLHAFKAYERSIRFLSDKMILKEDKLFYVAFSYSSQMDMSWSSMQAITAGKMAGYISDNRNRRLRRSSHKPCTFSLNEANRKEFKVLVSTVYRQD